MVSMSPAQSRRRAQAETNTRHNPDVGVGGYGFGDWPGQLARNAFDRSKTEPYTGRLEGKNYLRDIQLGQMRILAETYETEIMVR